MRAFQGEMMQLTPDTMTKDERSMLVYAETCVVDYSGLLEGQRMNRADMEALKKFKAAGLLDYGRIPAALLDRSYGKTHWVTFNESAWTLAHQLRRVRAQQISTTRKAVDAALAERQDD